MVKMQCDRLLVAFICVAAVARCAKPNATVQLQGKIATFKTLLLCDVEVQTFLEDILNKMSSTEYNRVAFLLSDISNYFTVIVTSNTVFFSFFFTPPLAMSC